VIQLRIMKTSSFLLCWSVAGALALAQAPAAPPRQPADPAVQQMSRAWAAFAENRLDESAQIAGQVFATSAGLAHVATGLLVRIEATRDRIRPALTAYERWLGQSRAEDRFLLYPVAHQILQTLSRSADPGMRAAATARLLGAGFPAGGGTSSQDMTSVAARAQGGDTEAQQQLAALVAANGATVRTGTVKALAASGVSAVPQLATLLSNRSPEVRAAAAESLGTIGGPQAVSALEAARSDQDPYVRLRVAVALALAGDQDAISTVTNALASPVGDIRLTAAEAFRDNPTPASEAAVRAALSDPNPLTRAHAAALLADTGEGEQTVMALLNDTNPTVREEAARTIEQRFTGDVALIRSMLASDDPWLRLYGSGALLAPPTR
jgi:HEAT repeat protein